jgi:hypothetical protein
MPPPRKKSARTGVPQLTEIPNIGASVAADLRRLGISKPAQLIGKNPLALYNKLARLDGMRHDPCLLDTFMAAVDYMEGGRARKWWEYTSRRKQLLSRRTTGRSAPAKGK